MIVWEPVFNCWLLLKRHRCVAGEASRLGGASVGSVGLVGWEGGKDAVVEKSS